MVDDDESLEASWARLQSSKTAVKLDVAYDQTRSSSGTVEDAKALERSLALESQDKRLQPFGLGVEACASGRRVVAKRAFAAGEVVLRCATFASALLPRHRESRCAACHAPLESPKRCGGCKAECYCDLACQRAHWKAGHKRECAGLGKLRRALGDDESEVLDATVACRAARRLDAAPQPSGDDATTLYPEAADARATVLFAGGEASARGARVAKACVDAKFIPEAAATTVASLVDAGRRNNFCVPDELLGGVAGCLSPIGALLNHSCAPPCVVCYDRGVQCFVAARAIAEGEEVTHSYVDRGATTAARRRELAETYGFRCACSCCAAPWAARDAVLEGAPDGKTAAASTPGTAAALALNERLRAEATAVDDDDGREGDLLAAAAAALDGRVARTHLAAVATLEARAHHALATGDIAAALPLFADLAARRDAIYAPLPHARCALDHLTVAELAGVAGDETLAGEARARARALLARTNPYHSELQNR